MLTTPRTTRLNLKAMCKTLLVSALLVGSATFAQAALERVGPVRATNGFPFWYQDTNGLAVDLCLPRNTAQLNAGVCLIAPTDPGPPVIPGIDTLPITFPGNYPDEAFYWNVTGVIDELNPPTLANPNPPKSRATMVLGLEAAFNGLGVVAEGQQIVFGRVRFIVDAPVNGDYEITYPYGVRTFPKIEAGPRAITFTDDIGIGAPGDFTGALLSGVGPFLKVATGVGSNVAAPFYTVPGDTSGDQFLADAATDVPIMGSPLNTNYFQVCVEAGNTLDGTNRCKRLDLFTVMGKVHTAQIPSPLVVNKATYSLDNVAGGTHVDVAATAKAGIGSTTPVLSFGDPTGAIPSTLMNGPNPLNQYFGQSIPTAPIPPEILITNSGDSPPTTVRRALTDAVTVTQAIYDPAAGTLTVTATSSDKVAPPQLTAIGLPGVGVTVDVPLTPGVGVAEQTVVYPLPAGSAPSPTVLVTSAKGGQVRAAVSVAPTAAPAGTFGVGGPIASDDIVAVRANSIATFLSIPVLANDVGAALPVTVQIVTPPKAPATAVFNPTTGRIRYQFNGAKVVGTDSFAYTVKGTGPASNKATVTVRVLPALP